MAGLRLCRVSVLVWLTLQVADRGLAQMAADSRLQPFYEEPRTFWPDGLSHSFQNTDQCLCLAMCQARPNCLGVAYNVAGGDCHLSARPPMYNNTKPSDQPWLFTHRAGQGMPGDKCTTVDDCSAMVGPAVCQDGVCACAENMRTLLNACLLPTTGVPFTGQVSAIPDRSSLLGSVTANSAEQCPSRCRWRPNCLLVRAVDDGAGGVLCELFSRVQASSSMNAADVDSGVQAIKFPRPAGSPPEHYVEGPAGYFALKNTTLLTAPDAHRACAEEGGILYPAESREHILSVVRDLMSVQSPHLAGGTAQYQRRGVFVGLDDTLTFTSQRSTFVSSRSGTVTELHWSPGEPNSDQSSCVYVNIDSDYHLNDIACGAQLFSMCQFVGRDEAVGRSWERDAAGMTLHLGSVFQLHSVRYEGGQTRQAEVRVTVSLPDGGEMPCATAAAELAAPLHFSRQLVCQPAVFASSVHLRFEGNQVVTGHPSVFATWLYDP
ncbi:uncharacterized protein LOC122384288 [Amphibalanus amphitrite]|uniref:uncharacterized protein LOC122384288 n=1 Tax=Amphibalanus amphitrite TaxID=1232801 RepID=UPI001C92ADCB|nr:uncharacterized protein LOC122384288 [Amphibalanus amphitrite]